MTLEHLYRRGRRALAAAILAAVLVALVLHVVADDGGIEPLVGGCIGVGVVAAAALVVRPNGHVRLDLVSLFLAAVSSAAVLGSGDLPSIAVPFTVIALALALLGCVAATLLLGERSLNEPRSRF